ETDFSAIPKDISNQIVIFYKTLFAINPSLFPKKIPASESGWVKVKIGNKEKDIPKNLLNTQGDYFIHLLKSQMKEAKAGIIELQSPTNKDEDDSNLLDYLSEGNVVLGENLLGIFHFAHIYALTHLQEICFSHIEKLHIDSQSMENVLTFVFDRENDFIKRFLL